MAHKNLEERIQEIPHRKSDLTSDVGNLLDNHPHRPDLSVWADWEDDLGGSHVVLSVNALWGAPSRHVAMAGIEARKLAADLIAIADAIDSVVDNYEPPDPPGFEAGFAANH